MDEYYGPDVSHRYSRVLNEFRDSLTVAKVAPSRPPKSMELLAIALIENAITGLRGSAMQNGGGRARAALRAKNRERCAKEDRNWFLDQSEETCSFLWCCGILGASPEYFLRLFLPLYMTSDHKTGKPRLQKRA